MNVMLCIPTFLLFQDEQRLGVDKISARQKHLAAFKILSRQLEDHSHTVYCALKTYAWKVSEFVKPRRAVELDWAGVQTADHVIACPMIDGDSSLGVHVEIGWATALGKPLSLLLHRPWTKHTVLVTGLKPQRGFAVRNFYYKDDPSCTFADLVKRIEGDNR